MSKSRQIVEGRTARDPVVANWKPLPDRVEPEWFTRGGRRQWRLAQLPDGTPLRWDGLPADPRLREDLREYERWYWGKGGGV